MTSKTATPTLTAADIDPRIRDTVNLSVPWTLDPASGMRHYDDIPDIPRDGWREVDRAYAELVAKSSVGLVDDADGYVIIRVAIPWSAPNGAGGVDYAFCTLAPGYKPVTDAVWNKYVGRSPANVAVFGRGDEMRWAAWTYYVHQADAQAD